jgi:hypothetical protein
MVNPGAFDTAPSDIGFATGTCLIGKAAVKGVRIRSRVFIGNLRWGSSITAPDIIIGLQPWISSAPTRRLSNLDEYLGPRMAAIVMPVYCKCLDHALPVYTIFMIDDVHGRAVAYERLLMPFSDGGGINHIIASLKTISEDGGFEIKNLLRANDAVPTAKLCAIIDRNLFHRMPGRGVGGDVIEFNLRSHLPRRQTRPAAPLSGTTARRGYATSFV